MKSVVYKFVLIFLINFNFLFSSNTDWEVEIIDNPSPGYLGFDWRSDSSYNLMDNYGNFIVPRSDTINILPFKFLKNGLWIAYQQSKFYLLNQDFKIVDSIPHPAQYMIDVHDVVLLNNGNYLLLCIEDRIMDMSNVVEGGKTDARVIGNVLVETDRTGTLHWVWKAIDHYSVTDATSDIDLTNQSIDLTHVNSMAEDLDGNLLISVRHFDEITKINRTNGNIMWRLGGKSSKKNQFTFVNDTIDGFYGFSHQHSINVLSNGNLLLFDNGNLKSPQYSRAVEYQLDVTNKKATRVWQHRPSPDMYVPSMGSVKRLLNGNTMLSFGSNKYSNKILEVKPDNSIAFKLNYKGNQFSPFFFGERYITRMDAVGKQIVTKTNYSFNDGSNKTGIDIQVNDINGSGFASVEKHYYSPKVMNFSDSTFTSIYPLRWVISSRDIKSIGSNVKIVLNYAQEITFPEKSLIYFRAKETRGIFQPLITSYNPSNKILSADFFGLGEFIVVNCKLDKPVLAFPPNSQFNIPTTTFLRWNSLIGASKYQIQLSNQSNFNIKTLDTVLNNNPKNINIQNLDFNTNYFWRVRGINTKDTSEWSEVFSFFTIEDKIRIPELQYPLDKSHGISNNDSLIWEIIHPANKYVLQISFEPEFVSSSQETYEIETNYYILKNLDDFRTYFWRVKAMKGDEETEWSSVWSFKTGLSIPKPDLPFDKSINNEIIGKLITNNVNGATRYHFQLALLQNFTKSIIDTVLSGNRIDYKGLDYFKEYYWRIRAINDEDTSNWSEIRSFFTKLKSPEILNPANNQKGVSLKSNYTWYSEYPVSNYRIQISGNSDMTELILDTNDVESNDIEILLSQNNQQYYWRVMVRVGNYESNWSEIFNFLTILSTPEPISPFNNEENVATNTLFRWLDSNNYNSYRFQISDDFAFSNIINDYATISSQEYNFKLNSSKEYFWKIRVETDWNISDWSSPNRFVTSPISSVSESNMSYNFYPNPATDNLVLLLTNYVRSQEHIQIKIINAMGIEIFKENIVSEIVQINLDKFPSGLYFININGKIEKFIKL